MQYQIYTFGNGEILNGVFNAIATCLNAQSGTLYTPLVRLSMIIGSFWVLLYLAYGDYVKALTGWIVPMTGIMYVFFVPQASVWIVDPISRYHQKVDHVPYGLAVASSYISKIGFVLTEEIEKVFRLPDDLKYQKTGTLFASNLLQQAKTFRITNEDLAENMRQFVGHCVAYDALLGRKYTIEDLRNSTNIWALVSTNPSPVRSFLWRDLTHENQPKARSQIITCREGVSKFNQQWQGEIHRTASLFGRKIFGKNGLVDAKGELLKYLPIAYSTLTNMASSAEELLKQNMMIYSVVDGLEQKSTSLGNAPNFALRRAYLQQRSTYETLGAMAAVTLPTMKAVLEAIAYSAFMFVIPLALLPFGYRFLGSWLQILIWLQMWAPLYAILNYIMTMAAKAKSVSALSLSNEAGITIANSVGLVNVNADIAAMAGFLAISIPFLCIALVKGVGTFVQLSYQLSNVTQGAAGQAASEAATGNYSFGNISQGSRQIANTSMLNESYAASYRSGSFHQADGRTDLMTTSDGQQILNVSSSHLPVSINAAETKSSQLSETASQHYQKAVSQSESSFRSLGNSYRNLVELNEQLSKAEHLSDNSSSGKSIEQSQAINKASQMVENFAQNNNLTKTKAASILANASVGAHLGFANGSLGVNASESAENAHVYQKAKSYAQSNEFQQTMREATQASQSLSHTLSDETSKRFAENVSGSYEEANQLRDEAMKSYRLSEDYQKQAAHTQAFAASINANYTQEFVDWLGNQKADNTIGRIGKQGAGYIMANEPERRMSYAQKFMEEKGLLPKAIPLSTYQGAGTNLSAQYHQDTPPFEHLVSTAPLDEIRQKARSENLEWDNSRSISLRNNFESKDKTTLNNISDNKSAIEGQYNQSQYEFTQRQEKPIIGAEIKSAYKKLKKFTEPTANKEELKGESQTKN